MYSTIILLFFVLCHAISLTGKLIYVFFTIIMLFTITSTITMIIIVKIAHQKPTPQESSWIFCGIFRWIFSGVFQRNFTCQRYCPKDCHLSSGCLLELSNELSVVIFQWISFVVISGV